MCEWYLTSLLHVTQHENYGSKDLEGCLYLIWIGQQDVKGWGDPISRPKKLDSLVFVGDDIHSGPLDIAILGERNYTNPPCPGNMCLLRNACKKTSSFLLMAHLYFLIRCVVNGYSFCKNHARHSALFTPASPLLCTLKKQIIAWINQQIWLDQENQTNTAWDANAPLQKWFNRFEAAYLQDFLPAWHSPMKECYQQIQHWWAWCPPRVCTIYFVDKIRLIWPSSYDTSSYWHHEVFVCALYHGIDFAPSPSLRDLFA